MSFPPIASDPALTAGSVDCSTDLAGYSLLLVGAADRGEGRYLIEKPCDAATRARRLDHRARPVRQHDQIEVDGAELVAEKQRTTGPEVILDNVEKPVGTRFRAA